MNREIDDINMMREQVVKLSNYLESYELRLKQGEPEDTDKVPTYRYEKFNCMEDILKSAEYIRTLSIIILKGE